ASGQVACRFSIPDYRYPALGLFGLLTLGYGAFAHVDDQPVAGLYNANNGIPRQGATTLGQLNGLPLVAVNHDGGGLGGGLFIDRCRRSGDQAMSGSQPT